MRPKVENKMEEYRDKGILVPQALPHNSFVEDYKGEKFDGTLRCDEI